MFQLEHIRQLMFHFSFLKILLWNSWTILNEFFSQLFRKKFLVSMFYYLMDSSCCNQYQYHVCFYIISVASCHLKVIENHIKSVSVQFDIFSNLEILLYFIVSCLCIFSGPVVSQTKNKMIWKCRCGSAQDI